MRFRSPRGHQAVFASLAVLALVATACGSRLDAAQQKLARLFETQAHFGSLVLRAYVQPGAVDLSALREAGRTARQARSDAEASADRLADEPSRPPMTARLAYSLTGIGRRIAHTSLTLQAAVDSTHGKAPGEPREAAGRGGPRSWPARSTAAPICLRCSARRWAWRCCDCGARR